jgi:hypothetical protein
MSSHQAQSWAVLRSAEDSAESADRVWLTDLAMSWYSMRSSPDRVTESETAAMIMKKIKNVRPRTRSDRFLRFMAYTPSRENLQSADVKILPGGNFLYAILYAGNTKRIRYGG